MNNFNIDLEEIKKKGDYSKDLLDEISTLISSSSSKEYIVDENLKRIVLKLNKARSEGINIDKLEGLILNFRKTLLSSKINEKLLFLNEANIDECIISDFDMTFVSNEFAFLKSNKLLDMKILKNFSLLYEKNEIMKMKFIVIDLANNRMSNNYDLENLMKKLTLLKEKGINTTEVEKMIMNL